MPQPLEPDYTLLDQPEITGFIFYPRGDWAPPPPGATDHAVAVAPGVAVACRFYRHAPDAPTVLFFHGNGEVVSDYDYTAPLYHGIGLNLFVADYRGYGRSGGSPAFSTMVADARTLFEAFRGLLAQEGYRGRRFAMGRSLGALSALEVAARYPGDLSGLIIESGAGGTRGWFRMLRPGADPAPWEELHRRHLAKLRSIALPLLSIHGERDALIPLESALELQEAVGSARKELVVIPGAGHNDLFYLGTEQYLSALRDFVGSSG
ncbi:MAG: alpha/beta hydrolase [Chloroflexi bacterium]|nr:alpha/beta hydrolase [Chloroflexota bacterium]